MHCKYRILREVDREGHYYYVAQRKRKGQWFWRTLEYRLSLRVYKFALHQGDMFWRSDFGSIEAAKEALQRAEWEIGLKHLQKLRAKKLRKQRKPCVVATMPPWGEQ